VALNSKPPQAAAGVALALLLTGWTGVGANPAVRVIAAAQAPSAVEQVRLLLGRSGAKSDELLSALVALGPAAIEPALDALRDGCVIEGGSEDPARLAPETRLTVLKALSRLERAPVLAALGERVARSAESGDRRVVLEILGSLGSAEELELLIQASTPPPEGPTFDSRVADVAQRSLELIFERHPSAVQSVGKRLSSAHEAVAPVLARAIVASAAPSSFDLLSGALGHTPALDLVLLPCLASAEGWHSSSQRGFALQHVRNGLASSNPMLARAAARACGDLGDALSAPALCERLEGRDAQLAAAAHASLKQLSGLGFAAQRERWKQWLQAEEAWHHDEAEASVALLHSEDEEQALQALQALVLHPLYRESLAPSVAQLANRSEDRVRAFACTVLGRWRWPASTPLLRELARDSSPEVAKAAADALSWIKPLPAASR